jgi:hypothetical protein
MQLRAVLADALTVYPVTIEVKDATPAIIVLNFANTRSFKSLNGPFRWAIDYAIYKRGEDEPFRTSPADIMWTRSVSVEVELERGEYVIQVYLLLLLSRNCDG